MKPVAARAKNNLKAGRLQIQSKSLLKTHPFTLTTKLPCLSVVTRAPVHAWNICRFSVGGETGEKKIFCVLPFAVFDTRECRTKL